MLKGKTITEELKIRIINPDALIVTKLVSCRSTDIRDLFMLITQAENTEWIRQEAAKRCSFKDRITKVIDKITSTKFKDDLQGVYGHIDNKVFEKHKKAILEMD